MPNNILVIFCNQKPRLTEFYFYFLVKETHINRKSMVSSFSFYYQNKKKSKMTAKVYIIIYSLYHHIYTLAKEVKKGLEASGVEAKIFQGNQIHA